MRGVFNKLFRCPQDLVVTRRRILLVRAFGREDGVNKLVVRRVRFDVFPNPVPELLQHQQEVQVILW